MRLRACVIGIAGLVLACGSGSASSFSPLPTAPPSALIVFTTWVADPNVTNGPEAGYKPAFTSLTGRDIQSAAAATDSTGINWLIDITFTPRGTNLFAQLTRDNVAACPSPSANCPQRHLGVWLDLTQTDIDSWEDPTYVAKVSEPFDLTCLTHGSPTTPCPKFVSDPITRQPIAGGHAAIACSCTERRARELAAAISMELHS